MGAWVLLRMRAHRWLLAAVLVTVVLTTGVLAALATFAGSVEDAGLRRALHGSAARTLLEIEAEVSAAEGRRLDATVREIAPDAFDGLPVRVDSSTRSGPYALPRRLHPAGAEETGEPDLTLLAAFDASRLTVTQGARPGPPRAGRPLPVALPESAARALGVQPGERITLTDRRHGPPLRVLLTGVYRPADPEAPYWRLDPLAGRGVDLTGYATYGPLLAHPAAFDSGDVPTVAMSWQARADFSGMTTARLDDLRAAARHAVARLGKDPLGRTADVSTDLPDLLDQVTRPLLVGRATLLVGALQLVVLAGYALTLVARTLEAERAGERAVFEARGASRRRLAAVTAAEALLLCVPAGLAATFLAGPLVRLLAGHGPLSDAGAQAAGPTDATALGAAVVTAVGCALVIAAPALRRTGSHVGERAARLRRGALPGVIRAGADIGLLCVAALAYWQLSRRAAGSGVLTKADDGTLGIDPVLVLAPALYLLAGAVLTLRLLPPAARFAERAAARSRGLALPLAGRQLARRSHRVAGPMLLLVLAVALGVFAVGQGASWDRSQQDQADHEVGADLRVDGSATPPFGRGGLFDDAPGIAAALPVARTQVVLPGARQAAVLATDTTRAPDVLRLRDDQTGPPLKRLLAPLHADRPDERGIQLPDGARTVRIGAVLAAADGAGRPLDSSVRAEVRAVVHDRYGVPHPFALGDLPADGRSHTLTLDLERAAGSAGRPAGPLRLTELQVRHALPVEPERHRLTVTRLTAHTDDGRRNVPVRPGEAWQASMTVDRSEFTDEFPGHTRPTSQQPHVGDDDVALRVDYVSGSQPPADVYDLTHAVLTLRPAGPRPAPVAAVATDTFLRAAGTRVGETAELALGGTDVRVRITGSVRTLPTTSEGARSGGALLLDLRALNRTLVAEQAAGVRPGEWWLAAEPGKTARVASDLRARLDNPSVVVRDERAAGLRAAPFGAGPRSALAAVAGAAALLAAAGFAVATAGAVRDRTTEFAVLRALGAPHRRIVRALAIEQFTAAGVAALLGAALGVLLTRAVVPLIVVTARAAPPVPELVVQLPPLPTAYLVGAVLTIPAVAVGALALRRHDPVAALRREAD